jgi:hypothetical protein
VNDGRDDGLYKAAEAELVELVDLMSEVPRVAPAVPSHAMLAAAGMNRKARRAWFAQRRRS